VTKYVTDMDAIWQQMDYCDGIMAMPIGTGQGQMTRSDKQQQLYTRYATMSMMAAHVNHVADLAGVPR
jgi:hypothetical protein